MEKQELIKIVFGWPGIYAFIVLATVAASMHSRRLMLIAFALSLPSSFYLFGGVGWVQGIALYIPLSLFVSAILLKRGQFFWPRVLLFPIYAFYLWFAQAG